MEISIDQLKLSVSETEIKDAEKFKYLGAGKIAIENPQSFFTVMRDLIPCVEEELHRVAVPQSSDDGFLTKWLPENKELKDERDLSCKLNDLAKEWCDSLTNEDRKLFNMDGFYPYYTKQPVKILFVGREACWMSGKNYTDVLAKCFWGNSIGGWTVPQYPFHRRQFYLAYALISAEKTGQWPKWDEVPCADKMAMNIFGIASTQGAGGQINSMIDSVSWAFMNLSKLSNDTGDWQTDERRYRPFIENNKERIREEIRLLNPDIIIGANVFDIVKIVGYKEKTAASNTSCYLYEPTDGFPLFLNCYHFSAVKKEQTDAPRRKEGNAAGRG